MMDRITDFYAKLAADPLTRSDGFKRDMKRTAGVSILTLAAALTLALLAVAFAAPRLGLD